MLSSANEVDDFVAIAGLELGFGPLRSREDFAVALDRDASGREVQRTQQVQNRFANANGAVVAVDNDLKFLN
jgi:hypothetical protein